MGSEMCIRDRYRRVHSWGSNRFGELGIDHVEGQASQAKENQCDPQFVPTLGHEALGPEGANLQRIVVVGLIILIFSGARPTFFFFEPGKIHFTIVPATPPRVQNRHHVALESRTPHST